LLTRYDKESTSLSVLPDCNLSLKKAIVKICVVKSNDEGKLEVLEEIRKEGDITVSNGEPQVI
jgi:hypothetical protein